MTITIIIYPKLKQKVDLQVLVVKGENIEQRMNRLISSKKCGPMILLLVGCFTRFGGNQYINSSATGRYEDYIVKEIVPYVVNI